MFKGTVENKGTKTGQLDNFERRYADPNKPGYVRVDFWPQPSHVVNELARRGYSDDRGPLERFLPLPPSPDPNVVRPEEVPAKLREDLAQAEAALEAHRGKAPALLDAIYKAEVAQKQAAGRQDKPAYVRAMAAEQRAREQYKALCEEGLPLAKRVSDAQEKLKMWTWDEQLYRSGQAERPQPSAGIF